MSKPLSEGEKEVWKELLKACDLIEEQEDEHEDIASG